MTGRKCRARTNAALEQQQATTTTPIQNKETRS